MVKMIESAEEFATLKKGDKPVRSSRPPRRFAPFFLPRRRRGENLMGSSQHAAAGRVTARSDPSSVPATSHSSRIERHAAGNTPRIAEPRRSPNTDRHPFFKRPKIPLPSVPTQVLVDFTASWCGPCKKIGPFFEELAAKYPDVVFVKIDVDDLDDVAAECGISAMPTFQLYSNGVKVQEMTGADNDKLAAMAAAANDM